MRKPATHKEHADAYELLRLENQLCFAMHAATRTITKVYQEKLEPLGLTHPQFLVLVVLWETDGLTIGKIGERLMLDSGTVTPVVKRLEVMQHVKRERGTTDEREVRVILTKKGRALRESALQARKFVGGRLQMSEGEILELRSDIIALISRLSINGLKEGAGPSDNYRRGP